MKAYRKSFIVMLLLPLLGLGCIGLINFIVDPYRRNQIFSYDFDKSGLAYKANYRIYKMQSYQNHPCPNILLGDSRIDGLPTNEIEAISGEPYFNFAYGGGTLYEAIDTFWFAAERNSLQKVYIGVNFNIYNAANRMNLVREAKEILASPVKYYLSPFVGKVSCYLLLEKFTGIRMIDEKPAMEKAAFWKEQLGKTTQGFYGRYIYPEDLYRKLQEISVYCRENEIELTFILPPTHTDLQRKIEEYDLTELYRRYKNNMNQLGEVFDFDIDCPMNRNKELFFDPYHGGDEVKTWVVKSVWRTYKY